MQHKILQTHIQVYDKADELSDSWQALLAKARQAINNSYAPYSNFHVGAALLLEDGQIVSGSNQENASFPLCLCAERVALSSYHAQFQGRKIVAIAVTAKNPKFVIAEPVSPCGACRQALSEEEFRQRQPIQIILQAETGPIYVLDSIQALLPLSFNPQFL